jgi:hypothetical protein
LYVWGRDTGLPAWIRRRGWASGDVTHTHTHSLSLSHTTLGKTHSGFPPSPPGRVPGNDPAFVTPPPRLPLAPAATRVTIIIIGFMRRRRPYPLEEELAAMAMAAMRQRPSRSRGIARRRLAILAMQKRQQTIDQSSPPRSPAPIPRSPNYRHGPPSTRPTARQSKHPPASAQL